jgi:hypothetical protein
MALRTYTGASAATPHNRRRDVLPCLTAANHRCERKRLWHSTRREDYEQRSQSVRAVRGRSPCSQWVHAVDVVGCGQLTALTALLRHPDPLMTAAFAANTSRHIRGICSVLEVDSTGSGQSGLQCCRPSLVGLGQSPHLVRCQSKISQCRPERLTSVDRI